MKKTTLYWGELVKLWFDFYKEKFDDEPTFNGASTSALKKILSNLQKRAVSKGYEWTEQQAKDSLYHFLSAALSHEFVGRNFELPIINQKFDTILRYARTNYQQGRNSANFSEGLEAISAMFAHSNNP